jgi:hypothetical protein
MAGAKTSSKTATKAGTGLFVAAYDISTGLAGAPTLHAQLSVYTPDKRVSGLGHVTQAVQRPPGFVTRFDGSYTYLTVMPKVTHVLLTLTGYPEFLPVMQPNAEVRMLLDPTWRTGTATFWYADGTGRHEFENAKVRLVEPATIDTIQLP